MARARKTAASLTPIDYYNQFDRITSWKRRLSAAVLVLAAGWGCALFFDFWGDAGWKVRANRLASHGPLARPHAPGEERCEACHVPFRPIGMTQARWAEPFVGDSRRSDLQCRKCHAAPTHHVIQEPRDLACASCHHEHRGRDASLVRLADRHCTQCHANLRDGHMIAGGKTRFKEAVEHFDAGHHPEFRKVVAAKDPGGLEFNHELHMTLGMASPSGGPVQSLAMLAEPDRPRYQKFAQGLKGYIQLDCGACHRLDGQDINLPTAAGLARGSGSYQQPIRYENQCRACHPLNFDLADPTLVMAHPLQPAQVHEALRNTYAAQDRPRDTPRSGDRGLSRVVPGRPDRQEVTDAGAVIEGKVRVAEKILFGEKRCGECHRYETPGGKPVAKLNGWVAEQVVRVRATQVPEVWFRDAVFDHSAHRDVDCRECHERAYRESPAASRHAAEVLLPGIMICLRCHSPRRSGGTGASDSGGAGFDCTECHRYHNADHPLPGPGALARDPDKRAALQEFLRGVPAPNRP